MSRRTSCTLLMAHESFWDVATRAARSSRETLAGLGAGAPIPRVASQARQPWAVCFNAFGVALGVHTQGSEHALSSAGAEKTTLSS